MLSQKRTDSPSRLSEAELCERAWALVPTLRSRALDTERHRSVPKETMDDLFAAGLLRYAQPARYGGLELDWGVQYKIGRIIARGCSATAWIVCVVGSHTAYLSRWPESAQAEVWAAGPDVLISTGSVQKTGTVRRVPGGYRLNGNWGFASGIDHAAWVIVTGRVEGEPEQINFLFPRKDFAIDDVWFVAGMRGTGTKDVALNDIFVPEHRALPHAKFIGANPPGAAVGDHYLQKVEFRPYTGSSLLGPIIGTAEGAFENYIKLTRNRRGAVMKDKISDNPVVQMRVSESAAELNAARALGDAHFAFLHHKGVTLAPFTDEERVSSTRDRAFATKLCLGAVERLTRMMGAQGLHDSNPVQLAFRDLHAMATQIGVAWDVNIPAYGKWILEQPTMPPAPDLGSVALA